MKTTRRIASAILVRAIKDWRKYGHVTDKPGYDDWQAYLQWLKARDMGFDSPREELLAFFASDWFELLCWGAGRDADSIRAKL